MSPKSSGYCFGPFLLVVGDRRLTNDGVPVKLSPKSLEVLLALVKRPQRLVTKEELLAEVWPGTFVEEGNLAVKINELRRVLVDASGQTYIETVPKHGYRFAVPVSEPIAPGAEPAVDSPTPGTSISPPPPLAAPMPTLAMSPRALRGRTVATAVVILVAVGAASAYFATRRAVSADSGVRSLVVLPFRAIDPAADQTHLGNGMADAISSRLTGLAALRVTPSAAVRVNEDPFDAGRRLAVDAVLTGSVHHAGAELRVTAQLSRVSDGGQLWAGRFDEPFHGIFAVQDAIAERIASRLVRELTAGDRAALVQRPTNNSEAYELYLRGREQWSRRTPEAVRTAIGLHQRAIELDPQFALAYAGLADAYNITHSGLPVEQRFPLARAAAEKAIALAPGSAEAHTSLAFLRYKFEWRWNDAEGGFKRALTLDPDYPLARHWYAEFLGIIGRVDEAVAQYKRAIELAPDSFAIPMDMSMTLVSGRRLPEARALAEAALALDPKHPRLLLQMSQVLYAEGRFDESAEWEWRALLLQGVSQAEVDGLRRAYRAGGMRGMNEKRIDDYLDQLKRTGMPSSPGAGIATRLGVLYARNGNRERALHWLNLAVDRREDAPLHFRSEQAFDFMRADPGFKALLARVGLDR